MYYGCDSSTGTFPCGSDFYLGRLGYGTTSDLTYFNTSAATTVGSTRTYAYWGIEGPALDPNYVSPDVTMADAWGRAQADAFYQARQGNSYVGTNTVFADVEQDFGGWLDPNVGINKFVNHAVFAGFLNRLSSMWGYTKGVYSSAYQWGLVMGTQSASPATVEWAANYPCNPANSGCPKCPTTFAPDEFGGLTASIWQNTGQPPYSFGDLDVATSLPS